VGIEGVIVSASPWEVPPPFLFNAWKHHAGFLRRQIAHTKAAELARLPEQLLVLGADLMDLYTGAVFPAEIGGRIATQLGGCLAPDAYRRWVEEAGGYRVLTLEDDSRWVLRQGEDKERYVHIHPGRWSPQTRRVRANVLKTAVLVLADVVASGGDPFDVARINQVRQQYLGLSPIAALADGGLRGVIELLAK
jgi:hypothetical protein